MAPAARLLDLTRLVSRVGRGPLTGIDRVERAYLEALLALPDPLFGLIRTRVGYVLLDRRGAGAIADVVETAPVAGRVDWLSRVTNRRDPRRAAAETVIRHAALARCLRPGLRRMLLRHLPRASAYINVGHANLSRRGLAAIKRSGAHVTVLVHDSIPLDHPEFARAGTPAIFAGKLAAVAHHADLVIHITEAERARVEAHLAARGRVPPGLVAPLGVPVPVPGPLPAGLDAAVGWFVAVGTIEPRKNHALLLDVWQAAAVRGAPLPPLIFAGSRGWAAPDLLARLDAGVPGVREMPGLPDATLAAIVSGARALLFPTYAEGYGLPPIEAAALGTPVVCSDLDSLREHLGDYPVYLDPSDSYRWMETIMHLACAEPGRNAGRTAKVPPTWADHFNLVLSRT